MVLRLSLASKLEFLRTLGAAMLKTAPKSSGPSHLLPLSSSDAGVELSPAAVPQLPEMCHDYPRCPPHARVVW